MTQMADADKKTRLLELSKMHDLQATTLPFTFEVILVATTTGKASCTHVLSWNTRNSTVIESAG